MPIAVSPAVHPAPHPASPDTMQRAISLALELHGVLEKLGANDPAFQLRLARAHALSVVDSLMGLDRESLILPRATPDVAVNSLTQDAG